MTTISTHILDTSAGRPAADVRVTLLVQHDTHWHEIASGTTNDDGRVSCWEPEPSIAAGIYKLTFDVDSYFSARAITAFYPGVEICFRAGDDEHYHVPLLLNPFGYATYRGS